MYRITSDYAAEQDVLEELARAAARPAVHVARNSSLEAQAGVVEDRRVQVLRVVHDDQHAPLWCELRSGGGEHLAHRLGVRVERALRPAARRGADLLGAPVAEPQQL